MEEDQVPLLAQPFFANGDPGPIVRSLAHVPELLEATAPFLGAVYGDSALSKRLKEIVILRISARMQCRFCELTHTAAALAAGLTHAEIEVLRSAEFGNDVFTQPNERALLRFSDELAGNTGPINDSVSRELVSNFSDAEVVELTLLAGATLMLNRYCTALGLLPSAATVEILKREKML